MANITQERFTIYIGILLMLVTAIVLSFASIAFFATKGQVRRAEHDVLLVDPEQFLEALRKEQDGQQ